MTKPLTISEISDRLNSHVESVCRELLPSGRVVRGEWKCGSVGGEAGDSLGVCLQGPRMGVWKDFADSAKGGDLIDLCAAVRGCSVAEAVSWAKSWLGIKDDRPQFEAKRKAYKRPEKPKGLTLPTDPIREFFHRRGLTDETMRLFCIGAQGKNIVFPYLQASMAPDFYRHLELLTRAFEGSSLAGFSNVNSDTSGYAVAQVRAMKEAMLGPVYRSAARQWRKLAYFYRHMVRRHFAHGGLHLRGALETTEVDGQRVRFRPVLAWTAEHCTDFAVDVHIDEGIVQDEIAERKSGLEMLAAGVWSPRRVMERSGVQDPAAEGEEIASTRLLGSPAADQLVIQMASAIAAQRLQATQADRSSPFMRALEQAQQQMAQQLTGGQPPNQGSSPVNALPGGQPIQQNQPLPAPQQGGPMAGPTPSTGLSQKDMGIPQLPGGVAGGQFAPAGA